MADLFHDWRILLALICIAGALWQINPIYTSEGWQTKLQKGFDIQGGARAVLLPDTNNQEVLNQLMQVMQTRMNVYGLADVRIKQASDLGGVTYIVVEAAGLTESDVRELLAKQGKFEAKIANQTIFTGSDITVQSFNSGIQSAQGGYRYYVSVRIINQEAMQKFAQITSGLSEEPNLLGGSSYLNATLDLFIDDKPLDSLKIASDLKGRVFDNPVIEGGAGSREEALRSLAQMEAILQTGALPATLTISSVDTVSPVVGAAFLNNTVVAAAFAILFVAIVVFLRYRTLDIALPIAVTSLAEVILILGIAASIKWQIDLAGIAGIIVAAGTGVDQAIIMTDELLYSRKDQSVRSHLKVAGFIILAAFGTLFATMMPLVFIGLGSVRGFAITTVLGAAAGFLITRPAYLKFLQHQIENGRIKI